MEAAPAAALEVAEPEFLLELLIVALDALAQFGKVDQAAEGDCPGKCREPIFGRRLLALGPFDQQPFFRSAVGEIVVAMRRPNAHSRKPRGQHTIVPSRHPIVRQACSGRPRASSLTETG